RWGGGGAGAVGGGGGGRRGVERAGQTTAADDADRALFIALSAALTGIAKERLSPAVDPVQINREYFKQAKTDPAFDGLMQIIRADPSNPDAAAGKVLNNSDPNIMYLGRSIILMWYLGAWYEPKTLQKFNSSPPRPPYPPDKIISPS